MIAENQIARDVEPVFLLSMEMDDDKQSEGLRVITERAKESHALPKQKLEALLKSLERSSIEKTTSQSFDQRKIVYQSSKPPQFSKTPIPSLVSSNSEVASSSLSPSELDSLNNLDNIDIFEKVFHPLPPLLSDKLHTNYNYASIGKKLI